MRRRVLALVFVVLLAGCATPAATDPAADPASDDGEASASAGETNVTEVEDDAEPEPWIPDGGPSPWWQGWEEDPDTQDVRLRLDHAMLEDGHIRFVAVATNAGEAPVVIRGAALCSYPGIEFSWITRMGDDPYYSKGSRDCSGASMAGTGSEAMEPEGRELQPGESLTAELVFDGWVDYGGGPREAEAGNLSLAAHVAWRVNDSWGAAATHVLFAYEPAPPRERDG